MSLFNLCKKEPKDIEVAYTETMEDYNDLLTKLKEELVPKQLDAIEQANRALVTYETKINSKGDVYENDEFDYEYGLSPRLSHKPSSADRGELKYVYCCILLTSGGHIFEVMSKDEIDAIKKSSAGASRSDSPWNSHYKSMAKKSVIRQLFRLLPISTELATAIDYDERASDGGQFNSQVINTIFPEENFEQQKLVQQTAEVVLEKVDTKSKAQRIAERVAV